MGGKVDSENQGGMVRLGGSPGAFAFASPFGPRIMFEAPNDVGTAPPAGGDGTTPPAGAGDPPPVDPPAPASRPDFIPENWWDAEKGFKGDDFNALVARDAERTAELASVPEAADKYEARLPESFKLPEGVVLPDGQEMALNPDDPRIPAAREFAFAHKIPQAGFEQLLEMGVQMDFAEQVKLDAGLKEQVEKLGSRGKERVAAVTNWLGAKLGGAAANALAPMLYTAAQVEAFEALMRMNRGVVPGSPGAGRDGTGDPSKIDGYETMTFRQRMAAIDAMNRQS